MKPNRKQPQNGDNQSIYNTLNTIDELQRKYILIDTKSNLFQQSHLFQIMQVKPEEQFILIYCHIQRQLKSHQINDDDRQVIFIHDFIKKYEFIKRDLFDRNLFISEQLNKYQSKQRNKIKSTICSNSQSPKSPNNLIKFWGSKQGEYLSQSNYAFIVRKVNAPSESARSVRSNSKIRVSRQPPRESYNMKFVTLNPQSQADQAARVNKQNRGMTGTKQIRSLVKEEAMTQSLQSKVFLHRYSSIEQQQSSRKGDDFDFNEADRTQRMNEQLVDLKSFKIIEDLQCNIQREGLVTSNLSNNRSYKLASQQQSNQIFVGNPKQIIPKEADLNVFLQGRLISYFNNNKIRNTNMNSSNKIFKISPSRLPQQRQNKQMEVFNSQEEYDSYK